MLYLYGPMQDTGSIFYGQCGLNREKSSLDPLSNVVPYASGVRKASHGNFSSCKNRDDEP